MGGLQRREGLVVKILCSKFGPLNFSCNLIETEDSISVHFELGNEYSQAKEYYIFGVYDGHGVHDASKISSQCSEHLPVNIAKNLSKKPRNKEEDIKNAIRKGFAETEQYMKSALVKEAQDSGCTALVAVLGPSKELIIANIGDSPGFISSNEVFSHQVTSEHDVHNKAEILRLRQQKKEKDGVGFSIYRLAPGRREKSWALDNTFSRGMQFTRSFGDFYIKKKAPKSLISEPEITEKYDASDINLLVLCSDGITNRLRAYKRMPTQVLLSYIKKHINKKDPLEEACHELVKLCDLVSQSGYCVDDMSILVIVFLNNKSLKQWCEDATKRAEKPEDWLLYKQHQRYEEDISDISEEDLGVESPKSTISNFDIYDTSNQYSIEEAEEFDDMTIPDI
ncbi:phosphatase 2C-like domain-containing protein [Gigaspora rosea]|uniref:Phosphatase 2C-like domain-containing protein n=1 Tax=Gigaspora rosea TaxID=44941 RepID=A0A397U4J2_9GLOM|nr:phosphatase 2C-like domain-containing protein [Gigaspora rosea]